MSREIWRMRRSLALPIPAAAWPAGVRVTPFSEPAARATHALLEECYAAGGGEVDPYEEWHCRFTEDAEFDASACVLAWRGPELVGAALCWSSAFIKDLCVHPSLRRRGLGTAFVAEVLRRFAGRGALAVELKAHSDNPSGATRLYAHLGFVVVERVSFER